MEDFVIIVQGSPYNAGKMREKLNGFNVIFSTWDGGQNNFTPNDIVVYSKLPEYKGPANLNLQKITTIAGLTKAKEMGYKRALKLRSDLFPTNMVNFYKSLDNDLLNFLCWHCHEVYPNCPGYLIDYLMSGTIEDLLKLWDIEDMSWCVVPEIHITQQYITKLLNKVNINYFLSDLNSDNDLHWEKRNIMLSTYQANHIYDKYRKYDFFLNK
jgi:hypothetical protein